MVVPVLPEAQPHRFVGTVRRETVESSGTRELLFGNIDRFDGSTTCLVTLKIKKGSLSLNAKMEKSEIKIK